jgi:glycosyltransferase involved in cell wall biosynthesis
MSQTKKILIVAPYPPPYGGISSHIRDVTKRLTSKDFSISILSFEKKFQQVKLNDNLHLYRVCNIIKFSFILNYINKIFDIIKIFKSLWIKKISLRNFLSSLNRSLIVNDYLNKFKINTVAIYGTETGSIIPFLKLLNPDLKICFTYYAGPIKDKSFYLKNLPFWKEVFLKSDRLSSSSKYCAEGAHIISNSICWTNVRRDGSKSCN